MPTSERPVPRPRSNRNASACSPAAERLSIKDRRMEEWIASNLDLDLDLRPVASRGARGFA